jgi:hypothetical protein
VHPLKLIECSTTFGPYRSIVERSTNTRTATTLSHELTAGSAGADKSSAQVTILIIDPGLSAAVPFPLALFTSADWPHHDLSCCCAWPISL